MNSSRETERLSWRDPDGFVINHKGRILRAVALAKSAQIRALLSEPWMVELISNGFIPASVELTDSPVRDDKTGPSLWLEHDVLVFPCYPHEITALQLYDSGQLTLKLALEAARHGWVLKDASAWNVLFSSGRPVFVDLLSFDKQQLPATWIAYGQFVRHFVLPLLLHRKLGLMPHELFMTNRDGVAPETAYQLLRGIRLMSSTAMEVVVLPKLLARAGSRLIAAQSANPRKSLGASVNSEVLLRTLRRLQQILAGLEPEHSRTKSVWKGYEEERAHYSEADLVAKREFVTRNLGEKGKVLDLGCNAGEFSLLAAEAGHMVIAADADHPALTRLYARIRGRPSQITPLLVNIGRPTPAVGWQNKEVASFLERSTGRFDCILVLGLIHHLLVGERATLPMIADLLDRLNPSRVILEWVDPTDQKFRQLAGLNSGLYRHLDASQLEDSLTPKFRMIAKMPLPSGTRIMYLWAR